MTMRISGLASGMDIDEIVSQMMTAQRIPLDKLYQKKTYTEWQRDDYRTINTALDEFDKLIADGIGRQATFIQKTVSVSNPDAISVKNINSTSDFSGEIKDVTLATAARMLSKNNGITNSLQKLEELGLTADTTIAIKSINKDGSFDQVTKKNPDGTPDLDVDGNEVKIDKVYTLAIKKTDTLQSVIDKINAESGVSIFFDEGTKQFSITAKNTGNNTTGAEIMLGSSDSDNDGIIDVGTSPFFTDIMNISEPDNDAAASVVFGQDAQGNNVMAGTAGTNARLTYNGLTIERASNTFIINGAEITLKKETTTSDPITFSSTADVDKIFDKVKEFVESYNALIANISGKISEKKNSDYPPLTDEQKKELEEEDIKRWEEKAKKGTLRNDSTLRGLLTNMRTALYTSVEGTDFGHLSSIGITTTKEHQAGGKLQIDEAKLRQAIADDPTGIYNLFMADGEKTVTTTVGGTTTTTTTIDFEKHGLARRLRDNLDSAVEDIANKAGRTAASVNNTFTLGKLLDDYEDKISAFERRLTDLEDRYYKQFTNMEKMISQANSQSAYLASYFSS